MFKKTKKFSLLSCGLKRKLWISFFLTAIIPLLVCLYFILNHSLMNLGLGQYVIISVCISAFITLLGFIVIKEVFDRISSVSTEAKLIAAGDLNRNLKAQQDDEVGILSDSLNQLTSRIRNNMDELKGYSEKTTEINLEIQRRVIVLSSIMQISSLISQGSKLEDILKVAVEKSRLLGNSEVAYLFFRDEGQDNFYVKAVDGRYADLLSKINISSGEELYKIFNRNKPFIVDKNNILSENTTKVFQDKFKMINALALPVFIKGRVMAMLGVGNSVKPFAYRKEDEELVDVFARQIAIAIDNEMLLHRVEKLEIKDALTGTYNEVFIRNRLQEEIKRAIAYQRPCSFVIFNIDNFKIYLQQNGTLLAEAVLKKMAFLIKGSVTEVDRVGRFGDDEFALILPERNKRQSKEIAEDIRKKIEFSFSEEKEVNKKLTVSAGVSENPLDGISAEELVNKAKILLDLAKRQGKNRIVAFEES